MPSVGVYFLEGQFGLGEPVGPGEGARQPRQLRPRTATATRDDDRPENVSAVA